MKSYLSLIPISAKVHKRQNRMTLLCIIFAVFLVTAVFGMADMGVRMEKTRLLNKHGSLALQGLSGNGAVQTLYSVAAVLFFLILPGFSVAIEFIGCLMPQSSNTSDINISGADSSNSIDIALPDKINGMAGVKRVFGRRSSFDVPAAIFQKCMGTTIMFLLFGTKIAP